MISDLHCHTIYSDGSFAVKDLIDLAKHIGLNAVAITDHDVAFGVGEAVEYGEAVGVKVVPGIELSTSSTRSIHILGYKIDYKSERLAALTRELLIKRRERKDEIIARLHALGVYVDASALDGTENVGRAHIAKLLAEQRFVSAPSEAFERYIGCDKPAYVPSKRILPKDGVELISEIGGYAVIAHPAALLQSGRLQDLIEGLIPYGLRGLEVFYPAHTAEETKQLIAIADKYRLIKTGGSDFHGVNKSNLNALGSVTCNLPREFY